ncbi:AT-rich interactive domain-containing protein 3C [Falco rusticolus]|uniref:AT-rich interactive domain-containing protein 3C n=1 Tax=Falco rusticolus TaxID=120794 RepID=UPI0018866206|nr:AT-rich interactive domain-containing protein 3C [Falco rusticolus]XP_055555629.1 AT-rich interactive domain-containing protein 3C [Falco cherrug]
MASLQKQQADRLAGNIDDSLRRRQDELEPGPSPGCHSLPPPATTQCFLAPGPCLPPVAVGEEEEEEEEEEDEREKGKPRDLLPLSHQGWTYEEQFKQLYELDQDPKRKEFLDDLFGFMQKRGTPVNRIPIMAKQVLDLYTLYQLVTDKGGLVEVINKKIWRDITKGLNLPTSITSAAFTLRTQYMKYLYPYECEKRALSSPRQLQAAIDSNRRESRRQTFGTTVYSYTPSNTPALLGSHRMPLPSLGITTHNCNQFGQMHTVKQENSMLAAAVPGHFAIPVELPSHHLSVAQAAASQAVALDQLQEKMEMSEPPEKKMALLAEEQQRLMQHVLQQNLLGMASQFPMNIKISNQDDRQETASNLSTNSISSINMSIDINGVVYTGVLSAQEPPAPLIPDGESTNSWPKPVPAPNPLLQAHLHSCPPASTSL